MMQDYATDFWRGMDDLHGFSFYRNPIQNIEPCRAITVVDVYRYLVGHYAKPQTDTLRSLTSPDYITLNVPPGAFSNVPLQTWSLSVRQS